MKPWERDGATEPPVVDQKVDKPVCGRCGATGNLVWVVDTLLGLEFRACKRCRKRLEPLDGVRTKRAKMLWKGDTGE